jgi:hypothetical protein
MRHALDILRIDQETGVAQQLGHGGAIGGDHRSAASHSLQNGKPESLEGEWVDESRGPGVEGLKILLG